MCVVCETIYGMIARDVPTYEVEFREKDHTFIYKKRYLGRTDILHVNIGNQNKDSFDICCEIDMILLEIVAQLSLENVSFESCSTIEDFAALAERYGTEKWQNVKYLSKRIRRLASFFRDCRSFRASDYVNKCKKYVEQLQSIKNMMKSHDFAMYCATVMQNCDSAVTQDIDPTIVLQTFLYCNVAKYLGINLYELYARCNFCFTNLEFDIFTSRSNKLSKEQFVRFEYVRSLMKSFCEASLCGTLQLSSGQVFNATNNVDDDFCCDWIYAFYEWQRNIQYTFINHLISDLIENDLKSTKFVGKISDRVDIVVDDLNEYIVNHPKKTEFSLLESVANLVMLRKCVAFLVGVDSKPFSYSKYMSVISSKDASKIDIFFEKCGKSSVEGKYRNRLTFLADNLLSFLSHDHVEIDVANICKDIPITVFASHNNDILQNDPDLIKLLQATYLMKIIKCNICNNMEKVALNRDVFMTLSCGEVDVLQQLFTDFLGH